MISGNFIEENKPYVFGVRVSSFRQKTLILHAENSFSTNY
ncbi:hypothetical protein HMPREF9442_01975 [Paraprevotella xylaniphila YIT 11841]|uniref:Uncharacterized protein n=1 Tax=Paraprevotella xylaniphila YIT 11841 TaxID=762982 RepID=F3QUV2_9BACT|nr:hypothetical protein HMPREF9442_01975 [Paraprevotella xylaniphila YIT 11841]